MTIRKTAAKTGYSTGSDYKLIHEQNDCEEAECTE